MSDTYDPAARGPITPDTMLPMVRAAAAAAAGAHAARRRATEAERDAARLAERRVEAEAAVSVAARRLRAVRGVHPVRLANLVRGVDAARRRERAAALAEAVTQRDAFAALARARAEEARTWRDQAARLRDQALALPRLLDEWAPTASPAGPPPEPLARELELTGTVRALERATERVRIGLDRVVSAYAWGSVEPSGLPPAPRGGRGEPSGRRARSVPPARRAEARAGWELVNAAVRSLLREAGGTPAVVTATQGWPADDPLAGHPVVVPGDLRDLVVQVRDLVSRLADARRVAEAERAEARHLLGRRRQVLIDLTVLDQLDDAESRSTNVPRRS